MIGSGFMVGHGDCDFPLVYISYTQGKTILHPGLNGTLSTIDEYAMKFVYRFYCHEDEKSGMLFIVLLIGACLFD